MMQFLKQIFGILLIAGLLVGCSNDDAPMPVVLGEYDNGVIVVNEGNFLEGDASLSFIGENSSEAVPNIFEKVNNASLGDVAQSAYVYDTLLFVVVNNSNKVEVLQRYTLKKLYTIAAQLPRYFTVSNGKGYLTEWVSFTESGRLSIVNLGTGEIEATISVGFGAEDVEISGDQAYVSNNFESSISVINLNEQKVTTTISLPSPSPAQMAFDTNGDLWVACQGGYDASFEPTNDGAFFKIDIATGSIIESIELNANISGKFAFNGVKDELYFYLGKSVFTKNVNTSSISTEPLLTSDDFVSLYGIGISPETGDVYLADSKNFLEDGKVYQYSETGEVIASFLVGRGPNGFVFN